LPWLLLGVKRPHSRWLLSQKYSLPTNHS